jgi:hypothetical protein
MKPGTLTTSLELSTLVFLTMAMTAWEALDWGPTAIIGAIRVWDTWPEAATEGDGNEYVVVYHLRRKSSAR